ncbi:MAG: DUF262 domain-containing protein [Niabella sp.]|nr:DUF262 domain-containing protein [Niabella sp.]
MEFSITKWTIKKLYDTYKKGLINLSPPYQRNFIWSISDQQYLIDSIQKNHPIPNFFLLQKSGEFEMVDGQQRSRTIISYIDGQFPDLLNRKFDKKRDTDFLSYSFPVVIITDTKGAAIEKFYAVVNKTGVHLNKPEVRKADFYDTNYLKLVTEITQSRLFNKLKVFTDASLKRMNDIEFVAELVILVKDGHVDKKENMDQYFKKDLSEKQCADIKSKINLVLTKLNIVDQIYLLRNTRYKQKNDFYTLFDFILNSSIELDSLKYFYKILVLIGKDIKPTQDACEPLKEYARNCVTQSNSKAARENRISFFKNLFLNTGTKANQVQNEILQFYDLPKTSIVKVEKYISISVEKLSNKKPNIEFEL